MTTNPAHLREIIRLRRPWFSDDEFWIMAQCGKIRGDQESQVDQLQLDIAIGDVAPLYYASLLGIDQLILILLATGEDINSLGLEGTCLAAAAYCGHQSTVQLLLENGAEVNRVVSQTSSNGEVWYSRTAVHSAVEGGHEEIIKNWLLAGADVNKCRSPPDTPLKEVVSWNSKVLVQLLIDAGADLNAYPGHFCTALFYACHEQDIDVMTILLNAGADPNMSNYLTAKKKSLFAAIQEGNILGAELLVKHGANLESIDSSIALAISQSAFSEDYFTSAVKTLMQIRPAICVDLPLITAAEYGYLKVMDYMLQYGATTPDWQDSDRTAAIHAAAFTPGCDSEAVELLLNAHININTYGGPFGSALQAAALSGKVRVVQILLENGASVNHAGGKYGTALEIAQDRLEDQEMDCPGTLGDELSVSDIEYYGPKGYVKRDGGRVTVSDRQLPKCPDYCLNIDIQHIPNADYQAIIDLLLPLGSLATESCSAVDVSDDVWIDVTTD
jgi:ankyrin repeat protein